MKLIALLLLIALVPLSVGYGQRIGIDKEEVDKRDWRGASVDWSMSAKFIEAPKEVNNPGDVRVSLQTVNVTHREHLLITYQSPLPFRFEIRDSKGALLPVKNREVFSIELRRRTAIKVQPGGVVTATVNLSEIYDLKPDEHYEIRIWRVLWDDFPFTRYVDPEGLKYIIHEEVSAPPLNR